MFLKNNILRNLKKRLGRGRSSGKGKTSGRGCKGQKSRSGSSKSKFFEGGQTPLFKRLPKFGFRLKKINFFSLNIINLYFFPFTIISIFILKKIQFIKNYNCNIIFKIFSDFFFLKKLIFFNIFLSKIFFFFLNKNLNFIFN